ncbi:MAG: thioredoxin family protein [Halanaerobiales bacterium]
MVKIEVLGTGCAKCKKTAELISKEIEKTGVAAEVIKVEEMDEILKRGVMMTPAVLVNGEKKCAGRVPSSNEIRSWFE